MVWSHSVRQFCAGVDMTSGESDACGINQTLVIAMSLRLEKVS
jgi:hypothetical protein